MINDTGTNLDFMKFHTKANMLGIIYNQIFVKVY